MTALPTLLSKLDKRRLAVFCGSAVGSAVYATAAKQLGGLLAERSIGLVYGGGSIGLMGVIADEVLRGGETVIGVIPRALAIAEVAHQGLTELRLVETMHARKSQMAALADGFVAMPGGLGTLEEIFEVLTWAQLRFHDKPCGFLNVAGFFDPLLTFLDHAVNEGLLKAKHRAKIVAATDPATLLDQLGFLAAPAEPAVR